MNNLVKKSLYASAGTALVAMNSVNTVLAGSPNTTFMNTDTTIQNKLEDTPLAVTIQNYVNFLMTFLYLIAVLYALWGGFQILTAGGDDEKVSKGKTILIQGATGLFVIWISGTIIKFILSVLAS
jgi:hypothetical protein